MLPCNSFVGIKRCQIIRGMMTTPLLFSSAQFKLASSTSSNLILLPPTQVVPPTLSPVVTTFPKVGDNKITIAPLYVVFCTVEEVSSIKSWNLMVWDALS